MKSRLFLNCITQSPFPTKSYFKTVLLLLKENSILVNTNSNYLQTKTSNKNQYLNEIFKIDFYNYNTL